MLAVIFNCFYYLDDIAFLYQDHILRVKFREINFTKNFVKLISRKIKDHSLVERLDLLYLQILVFQMLTEYNDNVSYAEIIKI